VTRGRARAIAIEIVGLRVERGVDAACAQGLVMANQYDPQA